LNVTECEGEGATEFVDVEGGGFDEGTGTTNVSKDCQDLKDQVTHYKIFFSKIYITYMWENVIE